MKNWSYYRLQKKTGHLSLNKPRDWLWSGSPPPSSSTELTTPRAMAAQLRSPRRCALREGPPDPRHRVLGIPGLGVGCWLFSSLSWVTSRQLGKAGAPRKKVDFEFSPNLPNPPDSILFLMLVFLDKERGPARYWILHIGWFVSTSRSRYLLAPFLSKVGDIE